MNNKEIYKYLTTSAKEELEAKVIEFENNVLKDAFQIASRTQNTIKEISLSDILKATEQAEIREIKEKTSYNRLFIKKERMYSLITITGILYSIAGVGVYLYQNNLIDLKNSSGLIITVVGIITALFGIMLKSLYSSKIKNPEYDILLNNNEHRYNIVERWKTLEKLAMEKTRYPKSGFNTVIEFYNQILSKEDFKKFKEILEVRNRIVHENYRPSKSNYIEIINTSKDLIDKAERIENKI